MMKKGIFFVPLVLMALMCVQGVASASTVSWYEPYPATNITRIEAFISGSGGTFTEPLTNFTKGNTGLGPVLAGWSSYVATNYPGTAVFATGPATNAVTFNINFTGADLDIVFYPMLSDRTVVNPESWHFHNGNYTVQNQFVPSLPGTAPVVPIPATVWLFGSGLLSLGLRKKNVVAACLKRYRWIG